VSVEDAANVAAGEEIPKPNLTTDTSRVCEEFAPSGRLSSLLAKLVMTALRKQSMIHFSDGVQTAAHSRLVLLFFFPFSRPESTAKSRLRMMMMVLRDMIFPLPFSLTGPQLGFPTR
jgi:hypothetical protein